MYIISQINDLKRYKNTVFRNENITFSLISIGLFQIIFSFISKKIRAFNYKILEEFFIFHITVLKINKFKQWNGTT